MFQSGGRISTPASTGGSVSTEHGAHRLDTANLDLRLREHLSEVASARANTDSLHDDASAR